MNASLIWKIPLGVLLAMMTWGTVEAILYAPAWMEAQISREADAIRTAAITAIAEAEKNLLSEMANTRTQLLSELGELRRDTMQRADHAQMSINEMAEKADARLADIAAKADGQITALRADLTPTLQHVESISAHADEASTILFRRDGLPAQLLGLTGAAKITLGETAQTMRTFRDAAPRFVEQGEQISANINGVAGNVNRLTKPHWYDRILGYTLNGAVLYRQLHPANVVVERAVEAISAQK